MGCCDCHVPEPKTVEKILQKNSEVAEKCETANKLCEASGMITVSDLQVGDRDPPGSCEVQDGVPRGPGEVRMTPQGPREVRMTPQGPGEVGMTPPRSRKVWDNLRTGN